MKTKDFKGTVLLGIEADTLEEAQDLAADKAFLKSLIESDEISVTEIKSTGVEETDPGFYDINCELSGKVKENVNLEERGFVIEK